jgi:hypothetical protein
MLELPIDLEMAACLDLLGSGLYFFDPHLFQNKRPSIFCAETTADLSRAKFFQSLGVAPHDHAAPFIDPGG